MWVPLKIPQLIGQFLFILTLKSCWFSKQVYLFPILCHQNKSNAYLPLLLYCLWLRFFPCFISYHSLNSCIPRINPRCFFFWEEVDFLLRFSPHWKKKFGHDNHCYQEYSLEWKAIEFVFSSTAPRESFSTMDDLLFLQYHLLFPFYWEVFVGSSKLIINLLDWWNQQLIETNLEGPIQLLLGLAYLRFDLEFIFCFYHCMVFFLT